MTLHSYLIHLDVHRMLERLHFKGATINDCLALAVFVDALADGLSRFFLASMLERPTLARL